MSVPRPIRRAANRSSRHSCSAAARSAGAPVTDQARIADTRSACAGPAPRTCALSHLRNGSRSLAFGFSRMTGVAMRRRLPNQRAHRGGLRPPSARTSAAAKHAVAAICATGTLSSGSSTGVAERRFDQHDVLQRDVEVRVVLDPVRHQVAAVRKLAGEAVQPDPRRRAGQEREHRRGAREELHVDHGVDAPRAHRASARGGSRAGRWPSRRSRIRRRCWRPAPRRARRGSRDCSRTRRRRCCRGRRARWRGESRPGPAPWRPVR